MSLCGALEGIKREAHPVRLAVVLWLIQAKTRCSESEREETGRESLEAFRSLALPPADPMIAHTDTGTGRLLFLNLLSEDYKVVLNPQESLLRFHVNVGTSHVRPPPQTGWGLVLFGPVGSNKLTEWNGVGGGTLPSPSKSCSHTCTSVSFDRGRAFKLTCFCVKGRSSVTLWLLFVFVFAWFQRLSRVIPSPSGG